MKKITRIPSIVMLGCVLALFSFQGIANAEETSSWWPQWKAPDITGTMKRTTQSVSRTTKNAWNATARTTKKAWNKTAAALDPYPDEPKPITNSSPWAPSTSSSSSSKKKSSSSEGGMFSWFTGSKKEEKPATVQDFLKQERPN